MTSDWRRLTAERLRQMTAPTPTREQVFARLGYEPNCLPRIRAAQEGRNVPPCGRCPQEQFHAATEDDVLLGGAAGGGKSFAMVMESVYACVAYPGIHVGFFRKTYPELAEELTPALRKINFAKVYGGSWNASRRELTFPNGSRLTGAYLESLDDATRYQSAEFQLIMLAERTLFQPGVCAMIAERLRSGDPRIPVLGIRCGSNPGGYSHGEVKERYVTATEYGRQVVTDEYGMTVRFIPAKVTDNPRVNPKYLAMLEAIPDPARRAAMKDGNWDVYVGQAFGEWHNDRHVVAPWRLPASWERYQGIDYGLTNPFAAIWAAVDEDGRAWVYREVAEPGVLAPDQAKRILEAEAQGLSQTVDPLGHVLAVPEPPPLRRGDPAMWAKRGEIASIAQVYANAGVPIRPANNDRLSGKGRVHEFLAEGPVCEIHREQGLERCPRLHVFETCRYLITTLPSLQLDPHRPEDVLKCDTDHAYDALRYCLMAIGTGASFLEIDDADVVDAEDQRVALHDDHGDFAALPEALGIPAHARIDDGGDDWDF